MTTDKDKLQESKHEDEESESVVLVLRGPRRRWPDDGVRVEKGAR